MSGRLAFFDTNVLVYADDRSEPRKQEIAIDLVRGHRLANTAAFSLQVLQEYFVTATKKLGVDPELAQRKVESLASARLVRFSEVDVIASIELFRLYRVSFWDAMIVHAARVAGAGVLYSEDLGHNSIVAGVRIRNPFL